jgi:hypothetical protein
MSEKCPECGAEDLKRKCPDCGKDWGHSYCGTCLGFGVIGTHIRNSEDCLRNQLAAKDAEIERLRAEKENLKERNHLLRKRQDLNPGNVELERLQKWKDELKRRLDESLRIIRRLVRCGNKPNWKSGPSWDEVSDEARDLLTDYKTERDIERANQESIANDSE